MQTQDHLHREIADLRGRLADANVTIARLRGEGTDEIGEFYRVAGLTQREAEIVSLIVKHRRVTYDRLMTLLEARVDTTTDLNSVQVHMTNLRKKLKPHGVEIRTMWRVGYEITQENVFRLRGIRRG